MPVFDDVKPTFEKLAAQKKSLAVFTFRKYESTKQGFLSVGLDQYIAAYFSSSLIGSKTEPTAYTSIAGAMGVEPEKICYITNDPREVIATAKANYGRVFLLDRAK
ncbi:MAG: HAD hydrolase-like protein [Candidatus Woesearchaeota archaeon]